MKLKARLSNRVRPVAQSILCNLSQCLALKLCQLLKCVVGFGVEFDCQSFGHFVISDLELLPTLVGGFRLVGDFLGGGPFVPLLGGSCIHFLNWARCCDR